MGMFIRFFHLDLEHRNSKMRVTIAIFLAIIGLASAVLPNLDNHECLNSCMRDTPLGNKFVATAMKCEDDDRRRSIDSDQETEEKTHCATYQHIKHYLDELNCELKANGWIAVEDMEDGTHKVHWNKTAVKEDIMSFSPNHLVMEFFMQANPGTVENWMEGCGMETTMTLMEKLLMKQYCADVYTDEERKELREIMENYGRIIAENMCIRTLFGVACECNDFHGNPLMTTNDD